MSDVVLVGSGGESSKQTPRRLDRPGPQSALLATARPFPYAFISYSSDDRDEVLSRVQMLSISGIDYFQDVMTLEPGDR